MDATKSEPDLNAERIKAALDCAIRYGQMDGSDHKTWCIDQIVRILTGCPVETRVANDSSGTSYFYVVLGQSDEYQKLIAEACDGANGPYTYEWDTGVAP